MWVADFTYIWTAEGCLYVAAVLDLYSRRIVGWSMQDSMTSQLVVDALMMGIWRRGKPTAFRDGRRSNPHPCQDLRARNLVQRSAIVAR